MTPEKENSLYENFPLVFRRTDGKNRYWPIISCGDGWFDLISETARQIESHIRKMPLDEQVEIYATCIKEKFGTLRFHMSIHTDEIAKIIARSEKASGSICEVCGKLAKLGKKRHWLKTCCSMSCGGDGWAPLS